MLLQETPAEYAYNLAHYGDTVRLRHAERGMPRVLQVNLQITGQLP
jgi:hypothetical protein